MMCQHILKDTMAFTTSHTVRNLTEDEWNDPAKIEERKDFIAKTIKNWGNKIKYANEVESTPSPDKPKIDTVNELPPFCTHH